MDEIQQNEFRTEMNIIAQHYAELLVDLLKKAESLERQGAEHIIENAIDGFAMGLILGDGKRTGMEILAKIWQRYISHQETENVDAFLGWKYPDGELMKEYRHDVKR